MTDEQNNAMLELRGVLRALCNDTAKTHGIPVSWMKEALEDLDWLYEEAA